MNRLRRGPFPCRLPPAEKGRSRGWTTTIVLNDVAESNDPHGGYAILTNITFE